MTTRSARPTTRLLAVLALAITTLLWAPAAAFGHASEVGSSPAAGEILDVAPSEVRIDYDSALLEIGAALIVRSADEESITTGPAVVGDRVLSVPVDPAVGPGEYSVAYRVVSQDGHTIENSFSYVVAGDPVAEEVTADEPVAEDPVAADPVAEDPVADEPVTDEPVADAPAADEPVTADEPVVADATPAPDTTGAPAEGSILPFLLFGGIGLVIVIGIIGAVLLRK